MHFSGIVVGIMLIASIVAVSSVNHADAYDASFVVKQTASAKVNGKTFKLSMDATVKYGYDISKGTLKVTSATGKVKFNDSTTYDFNKLQAKFKNGFKSLSLTGKVGSISVSSLLTLSQAMDFRAPVDTKAKSSTITLVVDKQRYLGRYGQSAVIDFDEKQAKLIAAENVAPPTQVLHFNLYGYEGAGNYEVYLTLGDKAGNAVAANGKIAISILDSDNAVLYSGTKSIKKSDFQQITWIDSGESLIGYTWTFPASLVKKGIGIGSAKVIFSTSDGKSISATYDSVYIPALDGEELAQALEERYLKSAIEVNQTVEKSGLKITAVRVGEFEHLEYDTWGDKQRDFRVDFVITNTGNEPISTPWKYVILDDASNQYDEKFLGGTLESKEIYPNVTIRGYLLFDTINENSSAIKIITSRYSYPVDDVWEFNINIHNKF